MPLLAFKPTQTRLHVRMFAMASQAQGFLSKRAYPGGMPALPYFEAHGKAQKDLWSPENPGGYIAATIAENKLCTGLVHEGLTKHIADFPEHLLGYQDMRGILELREALAKFLMATSMKGVDINPDHMSVLSGSGSVIDLLYHCISDPGQGVIIPAPSYPAFDNDLQLRNQVSTIPVHLNHKHQDYGSQLDQAAAAAAAAGHPVAAVMFTNPDNPTGRLYSRQQIRSLVGWCLRNKVHCVSDEIYANSVFSESAQFISTAVVAQQDMSGMEGSNLVDDLVHVIFGFSKDFCASGLRMGCMYSKNEALTVALRNVSYFSSTATPLQWAVSKMLADEVWLQHFLAENKRRLREAYTALTGACDAAGIPYQPAEGAMFLWIDLRAAFDNNCSNSSTSSSRSGGVEPTKSSANAHSSSTHGSCVSWEDEGMFWKYLIDQHKVVLTPGSSCHAAEPGYFRVCWAWPHPDSLPRLAQRLATAVQEYRQHVGGDLGETGAIEQKPQKL